MNKFKFFASFTLSITLVFLSLQGKAQIYASSLRPDVELGIKGGANFQTMTGSPFVPAYNSGFVAGIYGAKKWKNIGIRIEVSASSASYKTEHTTAYGLGGRADKDTVSKGDFKATYLSIPVLAEIKIAKKTFFEIGPQYNYMLSFTDNNGAYTKQFKNDDIFKKGEVCLDLGVNADLYKSINLGVRYVLGLTDINKGTYYRAYDQFKASSAQATLSIKLY